MAAADDWERRVKEARRERMESLGESISRDIYTGTQDGRSDHDVSSLYRKWNESQPEGTEVIVLCTLLFQASRRS